MYIVSGFGFSFWTTPSSAQFTLGQLEGKYIVTGIKLRLNTCSVPTLNN